MEETDRRAAHHTAVAGGAPGHLAADPRPDLLPGEPLRMVAQRQPGDVADVLRVAGGPGDETPGDVGRVDAAARGDTLRQGNGHLRVVGPLARLDVEPAAAEQVAHRAVPRGDLLAGHELQRRAERVAEGQAEQRAGEAL